ncbi:MAG: hypothetical protein Hyperionvirus21_26 [Hyperionvirus sp.]|uniref:Glutamine amidotransferase type-2 domain-containing protein n=1 Tax=Hyperionvirus sp. TaxID=2487770 RepID=A0A3G5AAZ4_9VIRU|nr:MAG: hypothetical protein Hyperionvirus21_26 [Hyperionvirus sp.]
MCSFLVTNSDIINLLHVMFFLKFRGPDNTNQLTYEGFHFVHNLLQITGEPTLQPFADETLHIICLYNGEIYNYKDFGDYKSDGLCLIDLYKKFGTDFIKQLDGEFAIVLFDFPRNQIIMSSDVFATKPIWYSINNDKIAISSYESGLIRLGYHQNVKIPANTTYILNISNLTLIETKTVYDFDLIQHKDNFNDWVTAFDEAIKKRAMNMKYPIFLCLSSGYDSGCIAASLNKQKIPYNTYTILATENRSIVEQRIKLNKVDFNVLDMTQTQFIANQKLLKENCEEFTYIGAYNGNFPIQMTDDQAATGLFYICSLAKKKNIRIFLSGHGADEIYCDYGFQGHKFVVNSCFGGKYPDNLSDIFPSKNINHWKNFYDGSMKCYMAKEEHVSGSQGIEGRYPYLDKKLVQEFLWLTPELKNSYYKAPLDYYLKSHSYPYEDGIKRGFEAGRNLK